MFAPRGLGRRWSVLIVGDLVCLLVTGCATIFLLQRPPAIYPSRVSSASLAVTLASGFIVLVYFQDLYKIDAPRIASWLITAVLTASIKYGLLLAIAAQCFVSLDYGRIFFLVYLSLSMCILAAWRIVAYKCLFRQFSLGVVAWGLDETVQVLVKEIDRLQHLGYSFLGTVAFGNANGRFPVGACEAPLIATNSVEDLLRKFPAQILVIFEPPESMAVGELIQCRVNGIQVYDLESFFEHACGKLPVPHVRESWLLFSPGFESRQWQRVVKRGADLVVASALMIIALPLAIIVAAAIKMESAGGIFFSQERVGLNGRIFRLYKFRSMRSGPANGGSDWTQENDPRITGVGRVIRRLRLDELPQLWNVLRGDMSLIGPRPEQPALAAELDRLIPLYGYRHFVPPGLTGWAQVCFQYGASVSDAREKLAYDLYYIKNWSLILDLQILLQTTKVVLFGRGAR